MNNEELVLSNESGFQGDWKTIYHRDALLWASHEYDTDSIMKPLAQMVIGLANQFNLSPTIEFTTIDTLELLLVRAFQSWMQSPVTFPDTVEQQKDAFLRQLPMYVVAVFDIVAKYSNLGSKLDLAAMKRAAKIAVLAFAAVVAAKPQHQPAAQYPAGVDPSRCPSYPNCDNAALHSPNPYNNHAANHWNPNWNAQPSWNAAPAPAPAPAAYYHGAPHSYQALTGPSHNYIGAPSPSAGGDRYPAGVNPQSCPNYPYCDNTVQAGVPQVAPLPGYTSRQYPAGVSPHTCPNFPYC